MSKVWKTETGRAFHSVGFILSLILGFVLTMSQAISHYLAFSKGRSYEIMKGIASYNPTTVFTQWFPMDLPYWSSVVFYLMFPVLAAMPFSASYLQDKKSGYLKNVYIRTEKKHILLQSQQKGQR